MRTYFAFIMGAAITLLPDVYLYKQQRDIDTDLKGLVEASGSAYTVDSKARFDQLVVNNIESYISSKRKEKTDKKYAEYHNAPAVTANGSHIYGNEQAPFTIKVFADLECQFCRDYHNIPEQIVDASNGLINWEFKHFYIPSHAPAAAVQAEAAECISSIKGNRAFWVFLDEVFITTRGGGQGVSDLFQLANAIDVAASDFERCLQNGEKRHLVQRDLMEAQSLGITNTPSTVLTHHPSGKSVILEGIQHPRELLIALQNLKHNSG